MIRVLGVRGQLCIHQSEVLEKQNELFWWMWTHITTMQQPYEAFKLTMSNIRINQSFQGWTLFPNNATYFSILKTLQIQI